MTLGLPVIRHYVEEFLRIAALNPDHAYAVTRVGCGLAGYADTDIAPMFAGASENCYLPEGWRITTPATPRPREDRTASETIVIHPSATADTRTCDFANVTERTLLNSSVQHIADVRRGLAFFGAMLAEAATNHDTDKLTDIEGFHRDFVTGFAQTTWWDRHRKLNRHHLLQADGVPADVNLIDVLDMIADCVMAGMARSGSVYPLNIEPDVLRRAFDNTVKALTASVVVEV